MANNNNNKRNRCERTEEKMYTVIYIFLKLAMDFPIPGRWSEKSNKKSE